MNRLSFKIGAVGILTSSPDHLTIAQRYCSAFFVCEPLTQVARQPANDAEDCAAGSGTKEPLLLDATAREHAPMHLADYYRVILSQR
jgi:hypothetical protein